MRNRIFITCTAVCAAALAITLTLGAALAQTGATDTAAPNPGATAPDLRQQCESALVADAQWRAELKQQLAPQIHAEDANQMLTNKKHVVMAYAALWILVTLFVVFMWLKQKDLKTEIARLEREVRAATQDSKAG